MLYGVKSRAQSYDTWAKRVTEALAADHKNKKGRWTFYTVKAEILCTILEQLYYDSPCLMLLSPLFLSFFLSCLCHCPSPFVRPDRVEGSSGGCRGQEVSREQSVPSAQRDGEGGRNLLFCGPGTAQPQAETQVSRVQIHTLLSCHNKV